MPCSAMCCDLILWSEASPMNAKVGAHEFHHTFTLRHVVTTCAAEMRVWVAPLEREPRYGRILEHWQCGPVQKIWTRHTNNVIRNSAIRAYLIKPASQRKASQVFTQGLVGEQLQSKWFGVGACRYVSETTRLLHSITNPVEQQRASPMRHCGTKGNASSSWILDWWER